MQDFDFDGPGSVTPRQNLGEPPAYVQSLNEKQREAVLITDGPLIVLAGAGSGKTKMLTTRIAYLIDVKGVSAHQILAVTFTNKAAQEMRERVSRTLAASSRFGTPEIGTFHSVCLRILRRELPFTPYTQAFTVYDDSDQLSLIKGVVARLGLDDKAFSPKSFQAAINRAKCDAIEPEQMEPAAHNLFEKHLKRVYEDYQKELFNNQAIDFGEIICLTYRVLRDHPEVRERYQKRFRYIHVDEYQDTNRAQYLLLMMLANRANGGHENVCVVGDEDQSIYGWRGADIRNILDFETDFPGAQVVKLEQNYRSTQTIITAASHLISNNRSRKDKRLWTENEPGAPIVRAQLADERAEAEMIVSEIKRHASQEERSYKDFAVFYRTHAQSRALEDVLRREKILYQIIGGLRFYDRKEIKDVLSYFKVVQNPADSISLKRVINVPARGIGKTTLDKIENLAFSEGITWWDALIQEARSPRVTSAGTAKKLAAFVGLVEKMREQQPKLLLSELYHLLLDETGYVLELKQENTDESLARIENLEELDSLLLEFEEDQFEALTEEGAKEATEAAKESKKAELLALFLEQSSLASDADGAGKSEDSSSVSLMTLHSSKGLEFPIVFLPGLEEGLFPSVRAWEEATEEDLEEERRLCYVGITRAREQLYLSHVVVRRIWGNVSYQEPARFFSEIPDDLLVFKDFSQGGFRTGSARQFGIGSGARDLDSAHGRSFPSTTPVSAGTGAFRGSAESESVAGARVEHPDYGRGKIVASEGSGQDIKVVIEFAGGSRRKFLYRFIRQFVED